MSPSGDNNITLKKTFFASVAIVEDIATATRYVVAKGIHVRRLTNVNLTEKITPSFDRLSNVHTKKVKMTKNRWKSWSYIPVKHAQRKQARREAVEKWVLCKWKDFAEARRQKWRNSVGKDANHLYYHIYYYFSHLFSIINLTLNNRDNTHHRSSASTSPMSSLTLHVFISSSAWFLKIFYYSWYVVLWAVWVTALVGHPMSPEVI